MKQCPVERLPPVAWSAADDIRGITAEDLYRETAGKVRESPHRGTVQVYLQATGLSFDPDGDQSPLFMLQSTDQAKGGLACTNRLVDVMCSKGAHSTEVIHGLHETGLARGVLTADQIQPG